MWWWWWGAAWWELKPGKSVAINLVFTIDQLHMLFLNTGAVVFFLRGQCHRGKVS